MSKYEEKSDPVMAICPYCGYDYQVEGEDMTEDLRIEECSDCGKKFQLHTTFSVTHNSSPDCPLNGEEHKWEMTYDDRYESCSICGKYRVSPCKT